MQQQHDIVTLFGPARSSDDMAQPADEQQLAGQPLTLVVELTIIEQHTSRSQRLWSLLAGLSSRLSGALSSGGDASSASTSQEGAAADLLSLLQPGAAVEAAAAGVASGADADSWRSALLAANAEEFLGSLQPPHHRHKHMWQRSHTQHRNGHGHRHELRSHLGDGVALPGSRPPSPLALAALDTVFAASSVVALACTLLLAADIWRHGWRPHPRGGSAGGCHPAGALVAVDRPEKQPLLVVVAADEVAPMQHGGCGKQ